MTGPFSTNLLQLVPTNVKVVEFGAFERWELCEFIVLDIEPFQVRESLLLTKDFCSLDPIISQV